jgi:hypothetical protein
VCASRVDDRMGRVCGSGVDEREGRLSIKATCIDKWDFPEF